EGEVHKASQVLVQTKHVARAGVDPDAPSSSTGHVDLPAIFAIFVRRRDNRAALPRLVVEQDRFPSLQTAVARQRKGILGLFVRQQHLQRVRRDRRWIEAGSFILYSRRSTVDFQQLE